MPTENKRHLSATRRLYRSMIKYSKVAVTDFLMMKTLLFETSRKIIIELNINERVCVVLFLLTYVNHDARFQKRKICTIFLCFFVCQISCLNFCVERKFQATAQILFYIQYRTNSLIFLLHFPIDILPFVPIILVKWYTH